MTWPPGLKTKAFVYKGKAKKVKMVINHHSFREFEGIISRIRGKLPQVRGE